LSSVTVLGVWKAFGKLTDLGQGDTPQSFVIFCYGKRAPADIGEIAAPMDIFGIAFPDLLEQRRRSGPKNLGGLRLALSGVFSGSDLSRNFGS
jgi:hypothetical protein